MFGIDFSFQMIERAAELNLNLKVASATETQFEDNSFDVILLFCVLTCIKDNEERNTYRYNQFYKKYKEYGVFELDDGAVLRHHDERYIKELLKSFEEVLYNKIQKKTMNGHIANGFTFVGRKR